MLSAKQRSKDKDALRERVSKLRSKLDNFDNPPCEEKQSAEPKESAAAESSLVLDRRERERERDQDSLGYDKERVRGNHTRERDVDVSRSPYHHVIAPSKKVKLVEPIILVKFNGNYRIKDQFVDSSSSSSSSETEFDIAFERSN